jgi:PEP-CTERM motif
VAAICRICTRPRPFADRSRLIPSKGGIVASQIVFSLVRPVSCYRLIATALVILLTAPAALFAVPSFTPINDLGTGLYLNQFQGGLYPNGSNTVPAAHAADGLQRAAAIQPLNTQGQPDANGKYVMISIGMSNTTDEFCSGSGGTSCASYSFIGQAAADASVNHNRLVIVDGAQGGQAANAWLSPNDATYATVAQRLATAHVTESQVSAIWLKEADADPTLSLPSTNADAYTLVTELGDILRAAKVRYPNLQQVFLSSRIYAGYATSNLNPEPYAYESGFAVKWLIEAQMKQMSGGGIDPRAGDLNYTSGVAPWIAWGPYMWADGLHPRSDGLIWQQSDFGSDGTHPSTSGRTKVGSMLLNFMLDSEFTEPWFLSPTAGDFNGDGVINAADYVVWRKGLGTTFTPSDYNVWRSHFGQTASSGAGVSPNAAVPEPSVLVLLMLATAGWCLRRGRAP